MARSWCARAALAAAGLVLAASLALPASAQNRQSVDFTTRGAAAVPSAQELINALAAPSGQTGRRGGLLQEFAPSMGAFAPAPPAPPSEVSLLLPISFGLNSARLDSNGRALVYNLAAAMLSPQLSGATFAIEGHTDASGSYNYNMQLSQQRANTVYRELVALGVPPSRLLSATGYGPTRPIPGLNAYDPRNRRVEVIRRMTVPVYQPAPPVYQPAPNPVWTPPGQAPVWTPPGTSPYPSQPGWSPYPSQPGWSNNGWSNQGWSGTGWQVPGRPR